MFTIAKLLTLLGNRTVKMDHSKLNELAEKYGKWSSWAVWGESKSASDTISQNLNVLNTRFIIVGLNASKPLEQTWANFHGYSRHDKKLLKAFNHSEVRGAYMMDLLKIVNANSQSIDSYISDNKNSEDIQKQINKFQKELDDIAVSAESKFILLGKKVQQYFTFFVNKKFYSNDRIFIPHYSGRGTAVEWIKKAKQQIENSK